MPIDRNPNVIDVSSEVTVAIQPDGTALINARAPIQEHLREALRQTEYAIAYYAHRVEQLRRAETALLVTQAKQYRARRRATEDFDAPTASTVTAGDQFGLRRMCPVCGQPENSGPCQKSHP